jgi:uncharacterized PurR-regulated membrane protein YhhQ (DUF165 family)
MNDSPQISHGAWARLGKPGLTPLLLAMAAYAISVLVAHDHAQTWTWAVLVLPVALSATPIVTRRRSARFAAAILMLGFCAVAALSVGVFFLPSTIATATLAVRS